MQKIINKAELKKLVEPHFHGELKKELYEVNVKEPHELLTWNRLDIAFKLIYLEYRYTCEFFAKGIYDEHIHALTLGQYIEPGSLEKNSKKKFISGFDRVYENILTNGFDINQSIIPQAGDGSIANGAHRLASAIYAKKPVAGVNIGSTPHVYDYQFFYSRNVSLSSIELAASKFIEAAKNVYVALIWPSAIGRDQDVAELIPNVVYKKNIKLNSNGAKNLLIKVYHTETWLGDSKNRFQGVDGKLVECFKNFNPIRVIAFQADSLDQVLLIKQRIRNLFNIGKHSIHITDTKEEAIRVSRLMFNENSVHFLNHANPYKYESSNCELSKFQDFIYENQMDNKNTLIDGGLLLSLYGLRESLDIDYLSLTSIQISNDQSGINRHDEDLKYHQEEKASLIHNPLFHFYYDNVKLISFSQLYRMKKARGEKKDINDIKMMDALLSQDRLASCLAKIRQKFYYTKIKLRSKVIVLLKNLHLYEIVRTAYQKIKQ